MTNATIDSNQLAVLRTITEVLGSTAGEPFFYSEVARRIGQQQREDMRRGFTSLVSAGLIEIGAPIPRREEVNPEYRFTDGTRSLKRYRLTGPTEQEAAA